MFGRVDGGRRTALAIIIVLIFSLLCHRYIITIILFLFVLSTVKSLRTLKIILLLVFCLFLFTRTLVDQADESMGKRCVQAMQGLPGAGSLF